MQFAMSVNMIVDIWSLIRTEETMDQEIDANTMCATIISEVVDEVLKIFWTIKWSAIQLICHYHKTYLYFMIFSDLNRNKSG